jgi:hypothetical protein
MHEIFAKGHFRSDTLVDGHCVSKPVLEKQVGRILDRRRFPAESHLPQDPSRLAWDPTTRIQAGGLTSGCWRRVIRRTSARMASRCGHFWVPAWGAVSIETTLSLSMVWPRMRMLLRWQPGILAPIKTVQCNGEVLYEKRGTATLHRGDALARRETIYDCHPSIKQVTSRSVGARRNASV